VNLFFLNTQKFFIVKQHFFFLTFLILLFSACHRDYDDMVTTDPIHEADTNLVSEAELSGSAYDPYAVTPRVNGIWNIDLTGFKYVYQSRVPAQWTTLSKYTLTGTCNYPVYTGSTTTIITSTNLCGAASTLMGLSLVPHSTQVAVPGTTSGNAKRLVQFARRYKEFYSSYNFGDYTALDGWKTVCRGTSSKKGEFTNWNTCTSLQNNAGATLSSQPATPAGRTAIKEFIRSHIQSDHPVMALVTINPSVANADLPGYFATSGGIGHMVLITGVTEQDPNNYYRVRFKDPLSNNAKTYEVNYTTFLNSMIVAPTNYNALAFIGQ
jgi:hypothetical protein